MAQCRRNVVAPQQKRSPSGQDDTGASAALVISVCSLTAPLRVGAHPKSAIPTSTSTVEFQSLHGDVAGTEDVPMWEPEADELFQLAPGVMPPPPT